MRNLTATITSVVCLALMAGCGAENQSEQHTANATLTSEAARDAKNAATSESNNNAGSILATIGNGLAAPFKYIGNQMDYASGHTPKKAVAHMDDPVNAD